MADSHSIPLPESKQVEISLLRRDGGTQPRAAIIPWQVDEYAADMERGDVFPAVTVFYDGTDYWLADGFHRVEAALKLKRETIPADVRQGTRRDAVLHSVGANSTHGARRTNEDKRRAVMTLLNDDEWVKWSDREIARRCGVSDRLVNNLRSEFITANSSQLDRTYITKHGTIATMNTANIGRTDKQAAVDTVYEKAPAPILEAVKGGEITIDRAYELTRALENAGDRTRAYATEKAIDDPELVKWLSEGERSKREWFDELTASGYVQPGDEDEAVHIGDGLLALQEAVKAREKAHRLIAQNARMDTAAQEAGKLPDGKYAVIYADPPWQYEHVETYSRAIENHYPTMTLDAICDLPVRDLAADNAILFMWATNPKLAEAMRVITAWGFEYRTNMAWVKPSIGMGYYVRSQHELLLIARRGDLPVPLPSARPSSVYNAPTTLHSRKPEAFYEIIERMYPDFPKVELFSRVIRAGWNGWGADYADAA